MRITVLALAIGALACGPEPSRQPPLVERSFVSMGSSLRVAIWATDAEKVATAAERMAPVDG